MCNMCMCKIIVQGGNNDFDLAISCFHQQAGAFPKRETVGCVSREEATGQKIGAGYSSRDFI